MKINHFCICEHGYYFMNGVDKGNDSYDSRVMPKFTLYNIFTLSKNINVNPTHIYKYEWIIIREGSHLFLSLRKISV